MEIEFKDVTKFFRSQTRKNARVQVVSPTSFTIKSGEFFTIIGPSGCGKSTLLNLLAGLDTPDSGQILVGGKPVTEPGPDRAVVFQEPGLMPWMTVQSNVEYGLKLAGVAPKERAERALEFLRMVHLSKYAQHLPHQLSGGMRQRVSIARALVLRPSVLLMDEPFSALDAQTRDVLHEELQDVWQKTRTTIVFVTHNLSEAVYLSDKICLMTAPPGSVKRVVGVPLSHPREKTSASLAEFANALHADLKQEVDLVAARELDPDWRPEKMRRQSDGRLEYAEGI